LTSGPYLHPGTDASPERIEFSFAVPDTLRGNQAALNQYVELMAGSLKAWLGEPKSVRHGDAQSWSWSLPTGSFTVGPEATSAAAVQNVALTLRRPPGNGNCQTLENGGNIDASR